MAQTTVYDGTQKISDKAIYLKKREEGCLCHLLFVPEKGYLYVTFDSDCPFHGNGIKLPKLRPESIFYPKS